MEKGKENICPKCGAGEGQMRNGSNRSGTQTFICRYCKKTYTPEANTARKRGASQ